MFPPVGVDKNINRMVCALYIASVLGAVALLLMLPRPSGAPVRKVGAVLGACTLGGLWLYLWNRAEQHGGLGGGQTGELMAYYYIFSAIAIAAAVQVITHTKPVYSALWFVLVILSSAGMFLLLGAEFMAFAMVIIYGGAILVTYVFVIMLAAQAGNSDKENAVPPYDRIAWEPTAAVAAGFLLLALLLTAAFEPQQPNPTRYARSLSDKEILAQILTERPEKRLADKFTAATQTHIPAPVTNVERVGLDLFRGHPLGLELAGVILLVSLVGAVVIARQKVET